MIYSSARRAELKANEAKTLGKGASALGRHG